MSTHQRPKRKGGPAPCTVRFNCAQPGESGCAQTFAHKRDRERHRATVCKQTRAHHQAKPGFRCRCSKTIKRWYQFKKHHSQCRESTISHGPYACQCGALFANIDALSEHHKSEMGRAGQPRKSRPVLPAAASLKLIRGG
ncbi:hypothetical protein F5Y16DRAFT_410966 [Xylariaceae sp. FL0255]|nr:hypothetical protein F5Y16DRAFT_410966 [Xylariaceae sp. FL0255]